MFKVGLVTPVMRLLPTIATPLEYHW